MHLNVLNMLSPLLAAFTGVHVQSGVECSDCWGQTQSTRSFDHSPSLSADNCVTYSIDIGNTLLMSHNMDPSATTSRSIMTWAVFPSWLESHSRSHSELGGDPQYLSLLPLPDHHLDGVGPVQKKKAAVGGVLLNI